MIIAANAYRWSQYYERQSPPSKVEDHLDEALDWAVSGGIESWEPFWDSDEKFGIYATALPKHGLKMASVYLPCNLMRDDLEAEIETVVRRSLSARELGARVVVTNPDPVNWNNTQKPDDLIRRQTVALETIGRELHAAGMTLAYHFHTSELLGAARELHHTMLHTNPDHVKVCFDAHWAWRGCGNSHLAMEDLMVMYGDRIAALHIRQSRDGVWTETLCDGDIDYRYLFDFLDHRDWNGIACIELATEAGTPFTMDLGEANRTSLEWLRASWPRLG